ncbi:MAG: GtrA family protein [Fusicatenibacter sp.]|nr:GtrA family protein [Fusicatenibacter sp.]
MKKYYEKYREMIIYIIFGVLTTAVNYAIYFTCTQNWRMNWSAATLIAWTGAVLFAYLTNRIWVFQSKASGTKAILTELIKFVTFRSVSLGIEWLILKILFDALHLNTIRVHDIAAGEITGKTIAQIIVILSNYLFSKKFVFSAQRPWTSDQ